MFGGDDPKLDYSDEAAREEFEYETFGRGDLKSSLFSRDRYNGFAVGKHWMDVTVQMWLEDIPRGLLKREELYDGTFPEWWLDRVLAPLNKKEKRNETF